MIAKEEKKVNPGPDQHRAHLQDHHHDHDQIVGARPIADQEQKLLPDPGLGKKCKK